MIHIVGFIMYYSSDHYEEKERVHINHIYATNPSFNQAMATEGLACKRKMTITYMVIPVYSHAINHLW